MYNNKKVNVVVPAYNEESLILKTLSSIPDFVEKIIVVNDFSSDRTKTLVDEFKEDDNRVILLNNNKNYGAGYSIKRGYKKSFELKPDITVVMAGDGQMDPKYLPSLLDPLILGEADYTKGNRLSHSQAKKMPSFRRFGNSILTLLNKVSTGYWHIIDPQNGHTTKPTRALSNILGEKITDGYGNPNDFLVALNIHNHVVKDVLIPPLYGSEKSGIKIGRFIFKTSWILTSGFFRRIITKYGGLNFHPVLLFFIAGISLSLLCIGLSLRLLYFWYNTDVILPINALAAGITLLGSIQLLLFALWIDYQGGK